MIEEYHYHKGLKIKKNVACIGYFDGVHKGHQLLINETVKIAKQKNLKAYLITFDPDPTIVINKKDNEQLNTYKRRKRLFESFGIEGIIIIPFDEKMMKMSKDDFCQKILKKLNIDTLICGEDFSFGYKGEGKAKDLKLLNINVIIIKALNYYGKKISSTRIKKAIKDGNYQLANKMLGYEYKK